MARGHHPLELLLKGGSAASTRLRLYTQPVFCRHNHNKQFLSNLLIYYLTYLFNTFTRWKEPTLVEYCQHLSECPAFALHPRGASSASLRVFVQFPLKTNRHLDASASPIASFTCITVSRNYPTSGLSRLVQIWCCCTSAKDRIGICKECPTPQRSLILLNLLSGFAFPTLLANKPNGEYNDDHLE